MAAATTSLVVFACVFGSALLGIKLRGVLPEHHLSPETKDTVKLTMGFVATMAALILGLLVASAKESYDEESKGVTQMAAKVIYLDELLADYGPETKVLRELFRGFVEQITKRMWAHSGSLNDELDPSLLKSERFIAGIQGLAPTDDLQTTLKTHALDLALELEQMRWLEYEEGMSTASSSLLTFLCFWIAVLFVSFGMFAPNNITAVVALLLAALSVAAAVYLIFELRNPFAGYVQIPNQQFLDALDHLGR